MQNDYGRAILCLTVSDANKELLLASEERIIPTLVDSLLLDPEHPRIDNTALQGVTDWESVKGPVQQVSRRSSVSLCASGPTSVPLLSLYACVV